MKNRQIAALFLCGIMSLSLLAGCASNTADATTRRTITPRQPKTALKHYTFQSRAFSLRAALP